MESHCHCKRVLTSTFLTLFQLLTAATSNSAASTASEIRSEKCGNMTIPYPFGIIKNGHFRDGFQILCNETTGIATTIDGIEIINITIPQAQMRVYNFIGYSCNHPKGGYDNASYKSLLGLSDRRYKISHTRNKLTAVGCQTLANIRNPYPQSYHYKNNSDMVATGCLSICTNQSRFVSNSTCSGVGCCEASIPQGLTYYEIYFDTGYFNKAIWDYSPCSFAFVAEEGFYSFVQSDIEQGKLYSRFKQAPVVLDWVLGYETCEEAKLNKSGNYACVDLHSFCLNSTNGPGYTCNCSQGYEGNPYIHDGCKVYMSQQCFSSLLMSKVYMWDCGGV